MSSPSPLNLNRCRLQEVHPELREQIFWNIVVEPHPMIIHESRRGSAIQSSDTSHRLRFERLTTPATPAIAQTCRQFRIEAISLFYPGNTFIMRLDPFIEPRAVSHTFFALRMRILSSERRELSRLEAEIRDLILEFTMQQPGNSAVHEATIRFNVYYDLAGKKAIKITPGGRLLDHCMCPLEDMAHPKLERGYGVQSIVIEFEKSYLHKLLDPQQREIDISGDCRRCGKLRTAMQAEWSPYGKYVPVSPDVLSGTLTAIEFKVKDILKPLKRCLAEDVSGEELRVVTKKTIERLEDYNLYW